LASVRKFTCAVSFSHIVYLDHRDPETKTRLGRSSPGRNARFFQLR
jgi:hypothetical protein